MPDWSYHTFVRPLLERLPADVARRFAVGCLGRMASLPHGYRIVDLLGHMAPGKSLARRVSDVEFSSPLGLAAVVDPEGRAVDAFSRFGFGWLVVGPVGLEEPLAPPHFERDDARRGIVARGGHAIGLERARQVTIRTPGTVRLAFEMAVPAGSAAEMLDAGRRLIEGLTERADLLVISPRSAASLEALTAVERRELLSRLVEIAHSAGVPLFIGMPITCALNDVERIDAFVTPGAGVFISGRHVADDPSAWTWGDQDAAPVMDLIRTLRERHGTVPIAADACVLAPRQALELKDAGADLMLLGAGLVHSGPGLAKRINEALEHRASTASSAASPAQSVVAPARPHERRAWLWGAVLGSAMFTGAVLAAWIALTSVLLPYDEAFLGRTREEIDAFQPRIVHFMTHDRVTLAGTMVSIGVLYFALSVFAMRLGEHWAQRAVSISAGLGFLTFFTFLGFGYFDPFHAFVTLALLQVFIQLVVQPLGTRRRFDAPPLLDNDRAWRLSQWGQLFFVLQAVGLIVAGATILFLGVTSVFVAEDIAFLHVEPEAIAAFDPELTPLIAHDRATFGGMLIAAGVGLLLTTLWSFRRGDRWLWWTYLLTILPPYAMTLWIHGHIGYTNQFHLSPVYIGIGLLVAGLVLSAPHLLGGRATATPRVDDS